MPDGGSEVPSLDGPHSKRQRSDAAAEGDGVELTSLLAAMGADQSLKGELDTGSSANGAMRPLAVGFEAEITTKLAESAPPRHKVASPRQDSSSGSSSGESSSSSGDESSVSGTDSEESGGPWITPHDPNRPKRPKTSYFMFLSAERKRVPGGTLAAAQKLSATWHAMSHEDKMPYEEMAAKDAHRYKQAMANYVAPAKIQLGAHPTPEEERLYATELARYRAKRERKKQRRRAIAKARREEREKAREQQRIAQKAALEAERMKQAQDVARLRERNLGATAKSRGEADTNSANEDGSDHEHAAPESSIIADIADTAPAVGRRMLRARNSETGTVAVQLDVADSHCAARTSRSRCGAGSDRESKQMYSLSTASKASGRAIAATDQSSGKQEPWRAALDVWSELLCQDVTMAWCKPISAQQSVCLFPVQSFCGGAKGKPFVRVFQTRLWSWIFEAMRS